MRNRRLAISAAAAVLAAAVLAGCGGSASGGGKIKLGVLAPFSGIYTVAGNPIKQGVELWLRQHGDKLGGRKVELTVADDRSTPQGDISAAGSLIRQHNVNAVVGLVNSAGALAARPILTRGKVIAMSIVANASALLDQSKGPYIFMVNPPSNEMAAASAVLAKKQGWTNVVGIADNFVGARDWLDPSLDVMKQNGLTVKARIYPPFPTSDYGPYVSKVRSSGTPGLVYPVMFGPSAVAFLKAYKSFGVSAPLYSTGSMLEPASISLDLLKAANGMYAYWNYSPWLKTPENMKFREAFKTAYHHNPGGFEMQAYVAMEFLDKAYSRAGGTDPNKVRSALQQVSVPSPVGQVKLGKGQAVDWNVYLTKVGAGPDGVPALLPVGPYVKNASPNMSYAQAQAALSTLPKSQIGGT